MNRLLMMRARNLVGPFFQRIGVNTYARSAGNFIASGGGGVTPPPEPTPSPVAGLGYVDVVADFGADPTGATDSTVAIQAAIQAGIDGREAVYFPTGTYLVSDTLRSMEYNDTVEPLNNHHRHAHGGVLVGSALGARPVIRLADGATGFDDDSNPSSTTKPVLWFWRQQTAANGGSTAPENNDGSRNYNQIIRNIDIDLGASNPGAVAIRHVGAEGCAIQNVKITATGGFAGLHEYPSSGGGVMDVEVIGGKHGVFARMPRDGASSLAGMKLSGQTLAPLNIDIYMPLTFVGCQITHPSGPILSIKKPFLSANDCSNNIAFIDCSFELTAATSPAILNTERPIYLKDVYVKGAATVVSNTGDASTLTSPDPSSWAHFAEYSYTEGNIETSGLIDGIAGTATIAPAPTVSATVPADLVSRHIHAEYLLMAEDADALNVMDFGAVGDGVTDDRAALQAAIDAGEKVLLPKGEYRIGGTLELTADTKLCGVSNTISRIKALDDWIEADFTPMLRTPSDAAGTALLDSLVVENVSTVHKVHHINWRVGRNSVVKNIIPVVTGPWPGDFVTPLRRTIIDGAGGGRWYVIPQAHESDAMSPGYRIMFINGTTEPLRFYTYHHQYAKVAGGPLTEVNGSTNVRFFGQKHETILPGKEAQHESQFGTPWPYLMLIENSSDILLAGGESPAQQEPGLALFRVYNSNDVTIVNMGRRKGVDPLYPLTDWDFVMEDNFSDVTRRDATGTLGIFKRSPASAFEIAHWPLDNSPVDVVGGFNGTPFNGPTYITDAAVGSHALRVAGNGVANQYIQVEDDPALVQPAFTLSGHIRMFAYPADTPVIAQKRTSSVFYTAYDFMVASNGRALFRISDGTTLHLLESDEPLSLGDWHKLKGVLSKGGEMMFFVDGVKQAQTASGVVVTEADSRFMRIGAGSATAGGFIGDIDDIRLFSTPVGVVKSQ